MWGVIPRSLRKGKIETSKNRLIGFTKLLGADLPSSAPTMVTKKNKLFSSKQGKEAIRRVGKQRGVTAS